MEANKYYQQIVDAGFTEYGKLINSLNQEIVFVEHPIKGEEHCVICLNHELKLAADSDFFELDDMTADHKEYEPKFIDGKLVIG